MAEQQGIVDEAHRQGVKVACTAHAGVAVRQSIESGCDSLELGIDAESIRRIVEKGIFMTFAFAINKNPARQSVREIQKASFQRALKAGAKIAFAVNASGLAANRQGLIAGKRPLNSPPWSNTE
jgi:imidazolonepropionase-like amidohydrolase